MKFKAIGGNITAREASDRFGATPNGWVSDCGNRALQPALKGISALPESALRVTAYFAAVHEDFHCVDCGGEQE